MKRFPIMVALPVAAILVLAFAARIVPGARTVDDAFITYRYARNLLAGSGFVYNPGERVLGTTTPFYTLLLAAFGSILGGDQASFPNISLVINAVADALTCLLLVYIGHLLGKRWAGYGAALAWAVAPFSVTFAIGGLETSVYILLLTAIAAAAISHRSVLAAFLAALALLTRPDALILIGPLFLERLRQIWLLTRQAGRLPRPAFLLAAKEALAFAIPVAAWMLFATQYFGSPLPHSIAAKSLAYRLPETSALVRLLQHYATPFQEDLAFGLPWIAVGLVLYPFLNIIGLRAILRSRPDAWPWLAFPWFYFAAFALAHPLIFRWYLSPPLPAYIFAILSGLETVLFAARRQAKKAGAPVVLARQAGVMLLVVAAPALLSLHAWSARPDHGLPAPAPQMAWYRLELLYRQAAAILEPQIQSIHGRPPVLAAGDVGVLGYFTSANILDTVGLNSPEATRYYPLQSQYYTINYAVPPDLVSDQQPDFVVILEVYGREGLLKDPRFQRDYRLLQALPTDIYGSRGMLIFQKRSLH